MEETVQKLLLSGKGILALDWSTNTIKKQFEAVGLKSDPELNRVYRQMLLTTPGIEKYIGGVIFFDETVRQATDAGVGFPDFLIQKGIIPGIKVDQGGVKFPETEEELTLGLDGLEERLEEYSKLGLKFTKWRSVFKITDTYPTGAFLQENLSRLAQFARISQEKGFVPVVEPEVSMKGNHTTTRCAEVTSLVLSVMFERLKSKSVDIQNIILKTNMVIPGQDSGVKAEPLEVSEATLRVLKTSVPESVPGIVFLSGGQLPEEATANLNEIVKRKGDTPWDLSFSFARALQGEALSTWKAEASNIEAAQKAFLRRLEMVSKARLGLL